MPHAIIVSRTGGPDVLTWQPVDVPAPGPGEVLLRHTAVGLNYIDTYHRTGLYPAELPFTPGLEAAGVVEELGPGLPGGTGLAVGDRVAYASRPIGAYAEARTMPADRVVRLPAEVDDRTAAAAMLKGMTAEYLLRRTFPVERGQTILVHAAAGGVGLLLCQWARALGATVIGTVGSEEKAELARANGCDHPLLYRSEDFVARTRELTEGAGVPVVYDSVGRTTFAGSLACLAPRGMLVSFGQSSGRLEPFDPGLLARHGSLYLTRPSLMDYTEAHDDLVASAAALFEVLASGAVRVEVRQEYPLREAQRAHEDLEGRRTTGSSVLLPG